MADQRGIADLYASEDFDDAAYELNDDFLRLKHTLVSQRKEKKLTQLQIAEFLGTSVQWVNDFEQYDYDPLASEIRAYALAVMMRIHTEAKPFIPPEPQIGWMTLTPSTIGEDDDIDASSMKDYSRIARIH